MKKNFRQLKIIEIIKAHDIEKQEILVEILNETGMSVTQATVSRDIKSLGLIKIQTKDGKFKYALPETNDVDTTDNKFMTIFKSAVTNIRSANNLIVLHTVVGAAQSACAFIDSLQLPEILGNIAGDDTIFTVVASNELVEGVINKFKSYLN